jgi:hypothetical protein
MQVKMMLFFSAAEYKSNDKRRKDVITRVAPGRLDLNTAYFKLKLLKPLQAS